MVLSYYLQKEQTKDDTGHVRIPWEVCGQTRVPQVGRGSRVCSFNTKRFPGIFNTSFEMSWGLPFKGTFRNRFGRKLHTGAVNLACSSYRSLPSLYWVQQAGIKLMSPSFVAASFAAWLTNWGKWDEPPTDDRAA